MSIRIMSIAWDTDLPDSQKLVLLALSDNANDDGWCWPSIATLTRKCGRSERTIQSTIRMLESAGHITRQEIVGKGCKYMVHPRNGCTPAKSAPVQLTTYTPAMVAPKPSRTVNGDKSPIISASRLPEDFKVPNEWAAWAMESRGWSRSEVMDEADNFCDYWHSKPGAAAKKLDWQATWRNWIRASRRKAVPAPPTVPL